MTVYSHGHHGLLQKQILPPFAAASPSHDSNRFSFPHCSKSSIWWDSLASLMPPTQIFFRIKWAPSLWDSSLWPHNSSLRLVRPASVAASTSSAVTWETSPQGLEHRCLDLSATQSVSFLLLAWLLRLSLVIPELSPPVKSLHSCWGCLGD